MKRIYLIYISSALCTFWIVTFYLGFLSGFVNYFPVASLFGSVLLFTLAAPLVVYKNRVGMILGLVGNFLILPFNLVFSYAIIEDGIFNWITLFGILLLILVLTGFLLTIKEILKKDANINTFKGRNTKLLLSSIPITLFILYLLFYGDYWNWQMFKI